MGHIRSISKLRAHCRNVCESYHRHTAISNARHLRYILYSNIAVVTLLVATILANSTSAIENVKEQSNNISLSVSTQCSFVTTNGASLNNSYTATGANGGEATFSDNGIHNFNIACNQFTGYTVKAYAEDLVNTEDASNIVAFYNYNEYTPRVENNSNVAIWSAEVTSGGNADASFGTSSETAQIIKSKDSASALEGDPFSIQYHAYIGRTTAPGVYEGKAVYTIAMNPYNPTTYMYTITYHANGIAGTPATQYGEATIGEDATVTLSTSTPSITIEGHTYNFLGWDTTPTALNVVYTAGETITIPESNPNLDLYAVWDELLWSVTYNANGGTGAPSATVTPGLASGSKTITLSNTEPTREGYTFLGWSEDPSATTATYQPGDSITLTSASNTVTLTAVWKSNVPNNGIMQGASCSSFADGQVYTMTDSRDGKKYLVGKLADGKCWMLQSLALEGGTTLTSTLSNVSSSFTLPSSSTSGWSDNSTKYMYNGTHLDGVVDNTTTNTGAYYSFIAATAGTGTGSSGNVSYSICPKGWRLPTGASFGEFQALYTAYSSNYSNMKSAFKAAYTSFCHSGSCPDATSRANWWSSTIYSGTYGYGMYMDTSSFYPQDYPDKYVGLSIRCVLTSS